jgi:uncharacterized repeat protein (TIGR03803 family)
VGCGTVFELLSGSSGYAMRVLHRFEGAPNDGAQPVAGNTSDGLGNIYGTTANGGANDLGTVYKIAVAQ